MPAAKIMLIRHAEKPSDDGSIRGVQADGAHNDKELIVRGWQRSGALVRLFAPRTGNFVDPRLAQPKTIFAASADKDKGDDGEKSDKGSKSLRPQHTVLALSQELGLALDLRFTKGQETDLAKAAAAASGPVLIAWQHEAIPAIVNAMVGNSTICPQTWPGARFDMVWVLDAKAGGGWNFSQVPQLLLPGDSAAPIT